MQETIFAILTDEQARSTDAIKASLDEEFSAGIPWFDKLPLE